MENLSCKCILEYKSFRMSDESEEGGLFTFSVGETYNYVFTTDEYWGDCYMVIENVTGFSMGLDKKKFDLYFEKII